MTDSAKPAPIELEKALLDPAGWFETPEAVAHHEGLSRQDKIEVLCRWHYDACEEAVAEEEGMPDGDGGLLPRIQRALEELSAPLDPGQSGPTKQHGLPSSAVRTK